LSTPQALNSTASPTFANLTVQVVLDVAVLVVWHFQLLQQLLTQTHCWFGSGGNSWHNWNWLFRAYISWSANGMYPMLTLASGATVKMTICSFTPPVELRVRFHLQHWVQNQTLTSFFIPKGAGKLYLASSSAYVDTVGNLTVASCSGCGGGVTLPISDGFAAHFVNNSDGTKKLLFSVANVSTGQTRTLSAQDGDYKIAGTNYGNIFNSPQQFNLGPSGAAVGLTAYTSLTYAAIHTLDNTGVGAGAYGLYDETAAGSRFVNGFVSQGNISINNYSTPKNRHHSFKWSCDHL